MYYLERKQILNGGISKVKHWDGKAWFSANPDKEVKSWKSKKAAIKAAHRQAEIWGDQVSIMGGL